MSSLEEKIERAERLQLAGDHRDARRLAREALEQSETGDPIAARAEKILEATGVDPGAIAVFGLTLAILLFLIIWYVL